MGRIYLNWAAIGIPTFRVRELQRRAVDHLYAQGPRSTAALRYLVNGFSSEDDNIAELRWTGFRGLARRLLDVLGLRGDGSIAVALTGSTSDAIRLILLGVAAGQGRRVVTTNLEHDDEHRLLRAYWLGPSTIVDLKDAVDNAVSAAEVADRVVRQVGPRDVLLFSHVTCSTGLRLPIKRIIDGVRRRSPEATIIVDGAHGPGNAAVDLSEVMFDYYVGSGHKWLAGPEISGFAVIRTGSHSDLESAIAQRLVAGCLVRPGDIESDSAELAEPSDWLGWGIGTLNPGPLIGLSAALAERTDHVVNSTGIQIRNRFESLLEESPTADGVELLGAASPLPRTGICTLRIPSWSNVVCRSIAERLSSQHGIVCEPLRNKALRFSFSGRETDDQLKQVVDAVGTTFE